MNLKLFLTFSVYLAFSFILVFFNSLKFPDLIMFYLGFLLPLLFFSLTKLLKMDASSMNPIYTFILLFFAQMIGNSSSLSHSTLMYLYGFILPAIMILFTIYYYLKHKFRYWPIFLIITTLLYIGSGYIFHGLIKYAPV